MKASPPPRLEDALVANLDIYFENLGAQKPHALYDMVVEAMERPSFVMPWPAATAT